MSISTSSNFDAGAIEVVNADNPEDIRLRVRKTVTRISRSGSTFASRAHAASAS